jgi:hypothetical protein
VLVPNVPPENRKIYTSMGEEDIPDLLVFKPTFMPDPDLVA